MLNSLDCCKHQSEASLMKLWFSLTFLRPSVSLSACPCLSLEEIIGDGFCFPGCTACVNINPGLLLNSMSLFLLNFSFFSGLFVYFSCLNNTERSFPADFLMNYSSPLRFVCCGNVNVLMNVFREFVA